ncbi:ABC transporter permease [Streptomyces sp. NPDC094149]|uniref:ABC transporter permease n=1 Tax=Streptomyces sp. NPDC094149 TaxID=3155079 RepID=UPI00331C8755
MSAVLETTATPVAAPQRRTPWAAVIELARFEVRQQLWFLPVFATLLLYVGWTGWRLLFPADGMDAYPALQDVDRATQSGPMLLGIALLVCVNRAALRDRRRGTDRQVDVAPMEPWRRTLAHLLSVVPFGVLTALVVIGEFTWQALRPGAVGHGSPAELAVGPLYVLLCGTLGVLGARLIPSSFAAPLLVVGFFATFLFLSAGTGEAAWSRWLSPVVSENSGDTFPSDLIGRPAAWHALYLTGLVLLVALGAVLAAGGRSRALKAGLAGALALTLAGAVAQSGGVSPQLQAARERASVSPEKEQTCVRHETSTYCAFPEWTPRAASWAKVVHEVQGLAGGTAHTQPLLVRQRIEARYGLDSSSAFEPSGDPHRVTVGVDWGGNRVPEFSAAVASVLVAGNEKTAGKMCDGRLVTVMWLALSWQDDPMQSLRDVRLDDSLSGSAIVLSPTDPLSMTAAQTDVVRELLGKPRGAVEAAVKAHWAQLTAPTVTTADAARLLGAAVPKGGEEKCEN